MTHNDFFVRLQPVSWRCEHVFVKCRLGLVVYKTNYIDSHCSELILSPRAKHFWGISNFDNWYQMSDFWGLTIMPGAVLLCPVGSNCAVKKPTKCQGTMHLSWSGSGWVCVCRARHQLQQYYGAEMLWLLRGKNSSGFSMAAFHGWSLKSWIRAELSVCARPTARAVQTPGRGAAGRDESEPRSADTLGRTCAACTLPARYCAFIFWFPVGA